MPVKSPEPSQAKALEVPPPVPGSPIYPRTYERMLQIEAPGKYLLNEGVNEFCKYGP